MNTKEKIIKDFNMLWLEISNNDYLLRDFDSGIKRQLETFISETIDKTREATLEELEKNYPTKIDDFYKGYNYAVSIVTKLKEKVK